jgi:hypothetical protein
MRSGRLFLMSILLSGCGLPSPRRVQRSFAREHRGATVLGVTEQANNHDAEFYIKYVSRPDEKEHEDVWHYWHAAEAWVGIEKKTIQ